MGGGLVADDGLEGGHHGGVAEIVAGMTVGGVDVAEFEALGAGDADLGEGDLVDEGGFEGADGGVVVGEIADELAMEDELVVAQGLGVEAVFAGILGAARFAFGRARPGGAVFLDVDGRLRRTGSVTRVIAPKIVVHT